MTSTMKDEANDPATALHKALLEQLTETDSLLHQWENQHAAAAVTSPVPKTRKRTPSKAAMLQASMDEAVTGPVSKKIKLAALAAPVPVVTPEKPAITAKKESFTIIPSVDMVGVAPTMVQLCATISGKIYQDETISEPEDLQKILNQTIPSDQLSDVSVLYYVEPRRNPAMTITRTGATLVIGWRGSKKFQDYLTDLQIDTIAPWKQDHPLLEVPKVHYDMVDSYFQSCGGDLTDMILGNYHISNKTGDDVAVPIQEIVLTGHSLGGGIAQIAHLYLKLLQTAGMKPSATLYRLAQALQTVTVRTLAYSSPMTTVLANAVSGSVSDATRNKTVDFLNQTVAPFMRNVVYSTDVVPRGYANLQYINTFLRAFVDDPSTNWFVDTFVKFLRSLLASRAKLMRKAEQYFHVAKIVYYESVTSAPAVYVDGGFANQSPMRQDAVTEKSFYDLNYTAPQGKVADEAFDIHMKVVTGPGLSFGA